MCFGGLLVFRRSYFKFGSGRRGGACECEIKTRVSGLVGSSAGLWSSAGLEEGLSIVCTAVGEVEGVGTGQILKGELLLLTHATAVRAKPSCCRLDTNPKITRVVLLNKKNITGARACWVSFPSSIFLFSRRTHISRPSASRSTPTSTPNPECRTACSSPPSS